MGARYILVWAVVAAFNSITHPAAAATAPSSPAYGDSHAVLTLPPVEVREARTETDPELRVRPGFARAYDVSRSHGRIRMVSDLLAGAVGVHVRQFGGTGSLSAVSIRGCPSNQVAVYLDGVPLNNAQYGVVNPADLPIEALSRIEVYRGGAPLGFESPGGGVIHLVTRQEEGVWSRVSAGAGSFGTEKADLAAGWRAPGRSALFVAQFLQSDGGFGYLDDNATPFNPEDDEYTHRRNNRSQSLGLTGRLEQQAGPVRLSLTHDHVAKQHGVPGTGANPALESGLHADRAITNLLASWRRLGSDDAAAAPSLRLYAIQERDRFADPQGELTGLRQEADDRTTKLGGQLRGEVRLPLAFALAASVEAREERYAPRLVLPSPRELPKSWRRSLMAAAEARQSAWGGLVDLVGSVRRQVTEDDFAGGPPYPGALPVPAQSSATWQTGWSAGVRAGPSVLALKTSVARLRRMPTLEEMFGNRGGIYGNPRAKPEEILTRDVGLVSFWAPAGASFFARPAWTEAQLSAYRSDATDLLVFVQNSQRSSVAQNISAARLEGLELSLRGGWPVGLLGELSWTRQWSRDEGQAVYLWGKELPGRPRDEGLVRLSLGRPRWNASYAFHFIAKNCLDRYNANEASSRRLHDISLGFTPWRWSPEWTAECRNLTDDRVEDFAGFPLPGRVFYVGARARLERKDRPHAAHH